MTIAIIKPHLDGLARLQGLSHIPTSTWRKWCSILNLEPNTAIEVWEKICHPLLLVSGRQPEISYILQLRATRSNLDIQSFKEEVAPILHTITFLANLKDESLTRDNVPSSILKFFRHQARSSQLRPTFTCFIDQFSYDLCRALVITQVVKGRQVCLSQILKLLGEGRTTLDHFCQLACKAPEDVPYAAAVRAFLQPEEQDPPPPPTHYLEQFRQALGKIYEVEAGISPKLRTHRLQAIDAFDPFKVAIPSPEEAELLAQRLQIQRNIAISNNGNGTSPSPSTVSIPTIKSNSTASVIAAKSSPASSSLPADLPLTSKPSTNGQASPPATSAASTPAATTVEVDDAAILPLVPLSPEQFGKEAQRIAQWLNSIETGDQVVWALFLDPTADLKDLEGLMRQLGAAKGSTYEAYAALWQISRHLPLKDFFNATRQIVKETSIGVQAQTFINHVSNPRRHATPDDRRVLPLKNILDHAIAALLRLENIKANNELHQSQPQSYDAQGVVFYCEKILAQALARADQDLLRLARTCADQDTLTLLDLSKVEGFGDEVVAPAAPI